MIVPNIVIALDFDGTVVPHRYPRIEGALFGCVSTLKKWQELYNVGYILSTMRSGKELEDAVKWFELQEIPLYGIQKHPTQESWTDSPKCYCDFMIDDRNVGQPLMLDEKGIPCVDWVKTAEILEPKLKQIIDSQKEM